MNHSCKNLTFVCAVKKCYTVRLACMKEADRMWQNHLYMKKKKGFTSNLDILIFYKDIWNNVVDILRRYMPKLLFVLMALKCFDRFNR